jgi:phytoene synthase
MTLQIFHWEHPLLALAYEALQNHIEEEPRTASQDLELDSAYRQCEELTRTHSRTFFLASGLLPGEKRRAARALYAFCRVSDDLIDRSSLDAPAELERWRAQTVYPQARAQDLLALAWNHARLSFQIPWLYAEQLIGGVAKDLKHSRYQTFSDLAEYCYGVACTVGLMSMHIIGFSGPEAIPYAIRLGVALQLTNILRDVGEDWQAGRVYLPQDELRAFDIDEDRIAGGVVDERWRAFMQAQIERNRELYAGAMPGISLLDSDGRFAIRAAAELYQAILDDIEAHDYDVFRRRASVSALSKVGRLPGIFIRSRKKVLGEVEKI